MIEELMQLSWREIINFGVGALLVIIAATLFAQWLMSKTAEWKLNKIRATTAYQQALQEIKQTQEWSDRKEAIEKETLEEEQRLHALKDKRDAVEQEIREKQRDLDALIANYKRLDDVMRKTIEEENRDITDILKKEGGR